MPKLVVSPVLYALFESYSHSINDPANELVHLYEVRDGLAKYYGCEKKAQIALGISKVDWQRIGYLANVESLEQGRHRGKHPGHLRPATAAELEEARRIVQRWIMAFANTI